jgi:hypothetical protein
MSEMMVKEMIEMIAEGEGKRILIKQIEVQIDLQIKADETIVGKGTKISLIGAETIGSEVGTGEITMNEGMGKLSEKEVGREVGNGVMRSVAGMIRHRIAAVAAATVAIRIKCGARVSLNRSQKPVQ